MKVREIIYFSVLFIILGVMGYGMFAISAYEPPSYYARMKMKKMPILTDDDSIRVQKTRYSQTEIDDEAVSLLFQAREKEDRYLVHGNMTPVPRDTLLAMKMLTEQAIKQDSDYLLAYFSLARYHVALGENNTALLLLDKMDEKFSDEPMIAVFRGSLYDTMKNKADANIAYADALRRYDALLRKGVDVSLSTLRLQPIRFLYGDNAYNKAFQELMTDERLNVSERQFVEGLDKKYMDDMSREQFAKELVGKDMAVKRK